MKLIIFWIRHGLSCANIHQYTHAFKFDPQLSYDGLECSEQVKKYVPKKLDFIFASGLKRAMETALSMFSDETNSNKKIISVPFICEQGWGLDNMISSTSKLKKYFEPVSDKLDLSIHSESPNMNKSDLEGFFGFLENFLRSSNIKKKKIKIGIVTHSHFMKHNNICSFDNNKAIKPKNNSIYKVNYNFKSLRDISSLYKYHLKKNIAYKFFGGCDFTVDNKMISCTKTKCKKKPQESYKNYFRCGKKSSKIYTDYNNSKKSYVMKKFNKYGGKRSRKLHKRHNSI